MPRPSFRVKEEDRKLVRSLAALGLRQEQIIETVGLRSPKTLRKHFRAELNAGLAEATLAVARVAYEMANSGRYPQMTIFWDKCNGISGEDSEEAKNDKRPQARTSSGGLVFLAPKKAADAA
jgi:hypothetical protein